MFTWKKLLAREAGVPIMQNVPLATDLFEHGDIEQYIPLELIEPIAEVLRWVQQLQEEQQTGDQFLES